MQKVRVRKRGKTYSYAFEAGKKPNGKRNPIEKGGFATKEEAYTAGSEAYISWKHGNIGVTSERVRVADFLDNWLDNHVKNNVRPLTYDSYYNSVKSRIKPYLGDIVLQELKPKDIDVWLSTLSQKHTKKTVRLSRTVLSTALKYAVYPCELISSNPVAYVQPPKTAAGKVVERKIVTDEDIDNIFELYPEQSFLHIFVLIVRYTGMRVSEVCGLEWGNIDFDTNTINVVQQLQRKDGGIRICPPKSDTSERKVLLDAELVNELKKWKEIQKQKADNPRLLFNYYNPKEQKVLVASKCFDIPDGYRFLDLVVTSPTGRYTVASYINQKLNQFRLNSHSFRHTHATKLAEIGVVSKAIAYRLGHSDTQITDKLYTHHTEEMAKKLVGKMEEKRRQNENADKLQT